MIIFINKSIEGDLEDVKVPEATEGFVVSYGPLVTGYPFACQVFNPPAMLVTWS
jgi:hypothetical protein